jgi:hypothetical protein
MEAAMLLKLAGAIGAAGILLTTLSAAPASATTNTVTIGSVGVKSTETRGSVGS